MKKPRLLVLAADLPAFQLDLEHGLFAFLENKLSGIEIAGSTASPYSVDSLLEWAVLGKSTNQDHFLVGVQKGCELYVGIKTLEREYSGQKDKSGLLDIFQIGERGFDLAKQNGIPAILLNNYHERDIINFVYEQTK